MRSKTGEEFRKVPLLRQRDVLCDVMLCAAECGAWLTLRELSRLTRYGEASISAQLRHLRKPQYGAFVVEKQVRKGEDIVRLQEQGPVWEYRLRRNRRKGRSRNWLTGPVLRGVVRAANQVAERRNAEIQGDALLRHERISRSSVL
jgi:hypothetical protein